MKSKITVGFPLSTQPTRAAYCYAVPSASHWTAYGLEKRLEYNPFSVKRTVRSTELRRTSIFRDKCTRWRLVNFFRQGEKRARSFAHTGFELLSPKMDRAMTGKKLTKESGMGASLLRILSINGSQCGKLIRSKALES